MNPPPPIADLALDLNGALLTDIACRQCGYNLRSLASNGRCTECGTPVEMSLRADFLRFSNPAWIEKVALGVRILVWMILISIVLSFAAGIASIFLGQGVILFVTFGIAVVGYCGAWLLAEPEPGGNSDAKVIRARKWVRIMLAMGVVGQLVNFMESNPPGNQAIGVVALAVGTLCGIAGLLGEYAKFVIYENLARRIPDSKMGDRASFLRKAYVGVMAISFLVGIGVAVFMSASRQSNPSFGWWAIAFVPIGLAMFVFGIMTIVMLFRLNGALQEQARHARQSWTQTQAIQA